MQPYRVYQGTTPVGGDAHFDVPLSNFASRAFATVPAELGLVAEQIFPQIDVGKQSDKYYVIEKEDWFRVPNTYRAPKTAARRVEFRVSSESYFSDNYALAHENALEDLANADMAVNLRRNSVDLIAGLLRLDQEQRVANLVSCGTNVGSYVQLTSADSWFSTDSADIIGQVQTAQAFMRSQTGLLPNVMVVDWDSWQAALRNTRLFDRFKHTGAAQGILTEDQLRNVFQVDRILVARGISNTGAENVDSAGFTSSNVWGNHCLLAHVGANTGLESRTLGARFRWRPAGFPAPFGAQTRVENGAGMKRIEIVEAGYFQDEKIIASDLGYVIETSSGNTGAG